MFVSYPNQPSAHFFLGLCLKSFLSDFKLDSTAGKGPLGLDQGSRSMCCKGLGNEEFMRDKFDSEH